MDIKTLNKKLNDIVESKNTLKNLYQQAVGQETLLLSMIEELQSPKENVVVPKNDRVSENNKQIKEVKDKRKK